MYRIIKMNVEIESNDWLNEKKKVIVRVGGFEEFF